MLIVFGGLPGVGKTTLARELARQLGAVHVRIDSIEHAIRESRIAEGPVNDAGYRAAYAMAEDNLRLGLAVIADCVNPVGVTRAAWRAVARRAETSIVEVEVTCSDAAEHRRRVERRPVDFAGSDPSWRDVVERDYEPWDAERVVIDTACATVAENVALLRTALETHPS